MRAGPTTDTFKLHQCSGLRKSSPDLESCKTTAEPVGNSLPTSEPPERGQAKLSDTRES